MLMDFLHGAEEALLQFSGVMFHRCLPYCCGKERMYKWRC